MNNAVLMGKLRRAREFGYLSCGRSRGHHFATRLRRQRPRFGKFHGDERLALVLADFVNRDDVWVPQASGRFRLGTEALSRIRIGELSRQQKFQRDDPPQADLPRFVNRAHSAVSDLLQQFVIADPSRKPRGAAGCVGLQCAMQRTHGAEILAQAFRQRGATGRTDVVHE